MGITTPDDSEKIPPTAEAPDVIPETQPVTNVHKFSIDAEQWEAYHKTASAMHVPNGCPNIAQHCCCAPGFGTPHLVIGAPCICASVMDRVIKPYEEQMLPEFEQEALVVKATGVSGYIRPENDGCEDVACGLLVIPRPLWDLQSWCCGSFVPQYYKRGSSWEPATLTWENVDRIELVNTDSKKGCFDDPSHRALQGPDADPHGDPLLRPCGLGVGIIVPCIWIPCCEIKLPRYTGLRIVSKEGTGGLYGRTSEVTLQVIALKEDPDHVIKVLNAAWAASTGELGLLRAPGVLRLKATRPEETPKAVAFRGGDGW